MPRTLGRCLFGRSRLAGSVPEDVAGLLPEVGRRRLEPRRNPVLREHLIRRGDHQAQVPDLARTLVRDAMPGRGERQRVQHRIGVCGLSQPLLCEHHGSQQPLERRRWACEARVAGRDLGVDRIVVGCGHQRWRGHEGQGEQGGEDRHGRCVAHLRGGRKTRGASRALAVMATCG